MTTLLVIVIRVAFGLPVLLLSELPHRLREAGGWLEGWATGRCRFCQHPWQVGHVCVLFGGRPGPTHFVCTVCERKYHSPDDCVRCQESHAE